MNSSGTVLALSIHGIQIECRSDDSIVFDRVREHFGHFEENGNEADIISHFQLSTGLSDPYRLARHLGGGDRVGERLYVGDDWVVGSDGNWNAYVLRRNNSRLIIHYYLDHGFTRRLKDTFRDGVASLMRSGFPSQRLETAVRRLVHFPVFLLLEERYGWATVHGASVVRDGRGVLLAGFDAVGKSTLALFLCRERGFRLLSDNFSLTDGDSLYAFSASSRIDSDSATATGLESQLGRRVDSTRRVVTRVDLIAAKEAPCVALILNRIGEHQALQTGVQPERAARELRAMWGCMPEFVDYGRFRALCALVGLDPWPPGRTGEAVHRLSKKRPSILVKPGLNRLSKVANMIEQCI